MGNSLSWIAVKGRTPEELQKTLGFKRTGKLGSFGKHSLVGRKLDDTWYLLIANTSDDKIGKNKTLAKLSRGGKAVSCSIEEHVMFSSCSFWDNGKKLWSVKHRGDQKMFDVVESGKLPDNYPSLKKKLIEKQKSEGGEKADVDTVFELPLTLAKQLVGFKHDEESVMKTGGSFEVFELNSTQKALRAFRAVVPWLYIVGALVGTIAIIAFIAIAIPIVFKWISQLIIHFIT